MMSASPTGGHGRLLASVTGLALSAHILRPLDLMSLVEETIDSVRVAIDEKALHVKTDLDRICVNADRDRLRQVFANLVANAIKFTPPGGYISVTLCCDQGRAIIMIADAGRGIPDDALPYIFEPFRQADSSTTRHHGGLGLGLAIAKHLVEVHGGSLSAANAPEPVRCGLHGGSSRAFLSGGGRPEIADVLNLAGYRRLLAVDGVTAAVLLVAEGDHACVVPVCLTNRPRLASDDRAVLERDLSARDGLTPAIGSQVGADFSRADAVES